MSSKNYKNDNNRIIKVDDTVAFLNKFAKLKRQNSKAKILAITGSAGKTSLKEKIFSLL